MSASMEPDSAGPTVHKGLDGVAIAESSICKVDGINGKLWYRGFSIEDLAGQSTFEEVAYLLLNGRLPNAKEFDEFKGLLARERNIPRGIIDIITEEMGVATDPMHVLRTAVSALASYDSESEDTGDEANYRKCIRIISKIATITAMIGRAANGKGYISPDPTLGHVDNFLYMLHGKRADKRRLALVEKMFILQAEHSTNASTFSAMVTASTLSDLYSAVTTGIATLKGPLHGEADEAALKMLLKVGKAENAERYITEALARKEKVMGFGHRVYKAYDPRAKIIRKEVMELVESGQGEIKDIANTAIRIEEIMKEKVGEKGIWPNVDFFAGPIYMYTEIAVELFTPIFASSRAPGWCAHVMEYWKLGNKLIRPSELYTGKTGLEYSQIGDR